MGLNLLCCTIVLFLLPVPVMGQENKTALIHTLYSKSGFDHHAVQLPEIVQADFERGVSTYERLAKMPQHTITKLRTSLKTAFSPERFKKEILIAFNEELSVDDLKKVLAWLDSSTGKKITPLEEAASRSKHYDGLPLFEAQLQAAPPSPKRMSIIQQLDSVSKATHTRVGVALKAQLAVAMVLVAHLPSGEKTTTAALTAAIEKNSRAHFEEAMQYETHLTLLYTYDGLTTSELKRYTAFASSPAGKKYHDAAASGIDIALKTGCDKWRQLISTILDP